MPELKVASWNIRKCVGLDWRRDPRRTVRVLSNLNAHVVALQEVDKRLGYRPAALPRHLVDAETELEVVDVDGHEASLGWHGNAILVTHEVEVQEAHSFHLPGFEPRGAILMDFCFRGTEMRVVAVHLGLMRQSRRHQFSAIRETLAARDGRPTIILGDFNQWSPNDGINPLPDYQIHKPGPTFHASRPIAALDRLAVSADLAVDDSEVVQNHDTRLASDHLPIRAKIDWRT